MVLDAEEAANALSEPAGAAPRAPLDPDMRGLEPLVEPSGGFRREPRRVRVHPLMHGKTDAVSDVAWPKEVERTHRVCDIQVLCRAEPPSGPNARGRLG